MYIKKEISLIEEDKKVYFENLNAIRFFAALMVIVSHTELLKFRMGMSNVWHHPVVYIIAKLGVVLFFVLSGFLISFLLFKEQIITKTIKIKSFYIRRILRIWPLYFMVGALGFFILPNITLFQLNDFNSTTTLDQYYYKLPLYIFFLPNLLYTYFGNIPYISQTWSIGAEEQFYLIWPILNKFIKNKIFLLLIIIFSYIAIKYALSKSGHIELVQFWATTPIDCMCIGGLFALILISNSKTIIKVKRILFLRNIQMAAILITALLISKAVDFGFFHYEVYSVLFGIIIINLAANPNRIVNLETPILNYLGKISYGLYMLHPIGMVAALKTLQHFNISNYFIIYPVVLGTIILIAAISYRYLEKGFIKKKIRYSLILSGDNAKTKLRVEQNPNIPNSSE